MWYSSRRMPARSRSLVSRRPLRRRLASSTKKSASVSSAQKQHVSRSHVHAHHYWMVTTLAAFPVCLALANFAGFGPVLAFIAGAIGSLLVLFLNILLEHEFWMLESHWRIRFQDPDFSHRLLVVSGALLLMVQTSFLIFFLLDQSFATRIFQILVTARV